VLPPIPADEVDLAVRLGTLDLAHPVMSAAGAVGWGRELDAYVPLRELGAFVTPSIHLQARSGLATPRLGSTPSGILHSSGLPGPGATAFTEQDLAWLGECGATVAVSIAGSSTDDFVALARQFYGHPAVAMLEVNICAPAADARAQVLASDPVAASRVISGVRRAAHPSTPVFAKLTADTADIVAVARACVDAGADGLSMIGPVLGMAIDLDSMRPALGGATGGLSGPAIRPIAVRCVWQVSQALPGVPIIGMGGIASGLDALQFILAGATAVAVGTAALGDPGAPGRIREQLRAALGDRGFASVAQAVGFAHRTAGASAPAHSIGVRS
jgi:dihydroorotate dehydrogenase (NAD+) catalytic subunit